MESLLLNPTREQVNAELARLCDKTNFRQRSRTAEMEITAAEWAAESALYRSGGDGVCNSYGSRASTTVVGCCWVTVGDVRVVRMEASRDGAPASAHGRREALPFGFNTAITRWEKAEPKVVVANSPEFRDPIAELAPAAAEFGNVFDLMLADSLPVVADWLDDHGHPTTLVRQWIARLAALTPAAV